MQTHTYLPERKGAYAARTRATDIEALDLETHVVERLRRHGLVTLGHLKARDPNDIANVVGVSVSRVRQWQAVVDFMEIDGIGRHHGWLLVQCGIAGVDELLHRERQAVLYTVGRREATQSVRSDGGSQVEEPTITQEQVDRWFERAAALR